MLVIAVVVVGVCSGEMFNGSCTEACISATSQRGKSKSEFNRRSKAVRCGKDAGRGSKEGRSPAYPPRTPQASISTLSPALRTSYGVHNG